MGKMENGVNMDICDEIKQCAEQLRKLIKMKADIRAVQTVQLRLQVLAQKIQHGLS